MNTYVITGITFQGEIRIIFHPTGQLACADFSRAELTRNQLEQYYRKLPLTEEEFIYRANASGANYRKES